MSKRVLTVAIAALLVAAGAAYALRPERGLPEGAPSLDEMAADLGSDVMRHLFLGHVPGRSGEIMMVPEPHNFIIGEWDLTTLGTATPTPSTSHPNPWAYLARVPIIFYGDGAPRGRVIEEPIDIAQIAPTYASLLGMDDFEAGASALGPVSEGDGPQPKAIFTIVIDGGGWNALEEHPNSWPGIRQLGANGTTYVNATIGSAPSITGALHATFGTGAYPLTHGIPGNQMRGPEGENTDTFRDDADPRFLKVPAVSELWDERNGNRPVVGTVSYEGWHLGMIGHGAQRPGGDKDIAVLWDVDENAWWINERFYELPDFLATTDLATLERYEEGLDPRDGVRDGTWFGHTLEELQDDKTRPATPAFARFTGDVVVDVMSESRIGVDRVTDIFWVEMKMPDYAGHQWNMVRPEEGDVIREVDRQIIRFRDELDRLAGRGNYLLVVSADHGQQPLPELTGGWRINSKELERDITRRFGDIIEKVTPVDIYVDRDKVEKDGVDLADVARFIATYTLGDNIAENLPGGDRVPEARLDERLFAAAFPTGFLRSLSDEDIEGFGDGAYTEGDLTSPPGTVRSSIP